jgi:type VI secretion system secreted protein VgrG
MCENQPMPITLAIADCQMDLRVVSFSGHDALNATYRFDIDLISHDPYLDIQSLPSRMAFLSLGHRLDEPGFHGQICHARQLYAGTCLSLYRITLMPRLQGLEQHCQRRVFHDLSVPQIIVQVLEEHGLDQHGYRFEPLVGIYPPRPLCVQHDETDLQLLQRLCEEEGIHLRFEHSRSRHLMILADDPVSFPEQPRPSLFQGGTTGQDHAPGISYLAERLELSTGAGNCDDPWREAPDLERMGQDRIQPEQDAAVNQPAYDTRAVHRHDDQQAHRRQVGVRKLERLRCERRTVLGRSNQLGTLSGQIIRTVEHPDPLFNDQWLLVEVLHIGRQPQALEGGDPHDMAAILELITAPHALPQTLRSNPVEPFSQGYRNAFRVLPWALPFRPARQRSTANAHAHAHAHEYDNSLAVLAGQRLVMHASQTLCVHTAKARFELSADSIRFSGPPAITIAPPFGGRPSLLAPGD